MSILEQLREKRKKPHSAFDLLYQYDLALENALLKLKNRGVEIADLKHRIKLLEETKVGISTLRVINK